MPYITEYDDSYYPNPLMGSNYSSSDDSYNSPQSLRFLNRGGPNEDSYISFNSNSNYNYDPHYYPSDESPRMLNRTFTVQPTYNALQVPHQNSFRSRSLGDFEAINSTPYPVYNQPIVRANSCWDMTTEVMKYTTITVYKSTTRKNGGGGGSCGSGGSNYLSSSDDSINSPPCLRILSKVGSISDDSPSPRMLNRTFTVQPVYNTLQEPHQNGSIRGRSLGDYDEALNSTVY